MPASIADITWTVMGSLAGALGVLVWWLFRWIHGRIRDLEATHVTRAEFNDTVRSLRTDIKNIPSELRAEIRESARDLSAQLARFSDAFVSHVSKNGNGQK